MTFPMTEASSDLTEDDIHYPIEKIVETKTKNICGVLVEKCLVKFEGYSSRYNKWMNKSDIVTMESLDESQIAPPPPESTPNSGKKSLKRSMTEMKREAETVKLTDTMDELLTAMKQLETEDFDQTIDAVIVEDGFMLELIGDMAGQDVRSEGDKVLITNPVVVLKRLTPVQLAMCVDLDDFDPEISDFGESRDPSDSSSATMTACSTADLDPTFAEEHHSPAGSFSAKDECDDRSTVEVVEETVVQDDDEWWKQIDQIDLLKIPIHPKSFFKPC